ncbi:MAG: TDP-N-acetylfucosamine:lipid II N-acetylfucosaminyltransferase [Thalassotalea sp.]|nr:TDP-N-acetylfucosamine:lipid II N-acetylfucosaminyltransferase [Thalassotalea sp.]
MLPNKLISKKTLIHVFDDTPHHYLPMMSFFINKCHIEVPQQFWARKPKKLMGMTTENVVFYDNDKQLVQELKKLSKDTQVIFHGLFELHIWRRLIFLSVAKQCSCIFWGADIYRHTRKNRAFKHYIAQFIHALLIKRFKVVKSLNDGDSKLVTQHLFRKEVGVLPYPLIGFPDEFNTAESFNAEEKSYPLKVMVGNSAAASNNHIYAFEQLSHLADENIEVIVPLNYAGTPEYIEQVIKRGHQIFGSKFKPITAMLSKVEYDELLMQVDASIFAHNRQQGLYVVYAMFLQGKPMFLSSNTSSFIDLNKLGFKVYDIDKVNLLTIDDFDLLSRSIKTENIDLMHKTFTEEALAPKWSCFLNGLVK